MIKPDTYINIQGWMRTDLDLSGNELIAYAIIYGFSQDGVSRFEGSRQYIADWCGISVRAVQTILNNLVEKKLILKYEKTVNGLKLCAYAVNFTTGEETSLGGEETSLGGEETSLNNIDNTIIDNIDNIIGKPIISDEPNYNNSVVGNNYTDDGFEGHSYSDFLGSNRKKRTAKKKSKSSLYSKCEMEIIQFTSNAITVNMLTEYLQLRLQMKDKPIAGVNQWKGMLNKLAELMTDERSCQRIIQQSIEHGWAAFYPLKAETSYHKGKDIKTVSCEGNTVKGTKRTNRLEEEEVRLVDERF